MDLQELGAPVALVPLKAVAVAAVAAVATRVAWAA